MTAPDHNATASAGLAAWQRGDVVGALAAFEQVAAAGVASPRLWLLLAEARAAAGKGDVVAALDAVLAAEPRNVRALLRRGEHADDDRAASSFYKLALGYASDVDRRDPRTAAMLSRAEAHMAAASARYVDHLKASVADHAAGARFDEAIAIVTGEKQVFLQQPTSFFYPQLPHRQFWEPNEFDWAADFAAAAPAIRAELDALLASDAAFHPYVQADPTRANKAHKLLNDPSWSAFHLLEGGRPVAGNADRCPAALAALAKLPIPVIADRSPMALFSVLKPHTHIPPHTGMLNTRLIVHLPLIVPSDCRLRVGNEVRTVEAGVPLIFDDSIEHEAWNDSDETRIILLTEIWRPELTAAECAAITRLYESVGLYSGGQ